MRPAACCLVLASLLVVATALAQDDGVDAAAWLGRAQTAENEARPLDALHDWQALLALAPRSRLAGRARARIGWIEARSEGEYVPLGHLMHYLALPMAERDEATIATFEREVAGMPDGLVRPEARLAVADDWARLGETERALAAWNAELTDPRAEDGHRALVRESMARARMDSGDLAGAIGELDDADLGGIALHRVATRRLRAQTWVPIAYALFGAFVLAVIALVLRSGRAVAIARSIDPLRIAVALVVGVGPWAIVWWWGDDSVGAFEAFAPCSFVIVLGSFLAGEATERAPARAAMGLLAVIAALATAYASVALHGEALPFA